MKISVIIPVLNEAATIESTLNALQPMRARGHEVIVVDGGSVDSTDKLAEPLVDMVVSSESGRATQMHAGTKKASGEIFWFLHADTLAPQNADRAILAALELTPENSG